MAEYATYPSLRGKTVLITGGAQGIGAAAVELFCRQGSDVVFFDRDEVAADALLEKIREIPGATQPSFAACDVTDLEQLKRRADETLARHGGRGGVDVLINNAGAAAASARVPTDAVTPESFEQTVNVNLRHQFFLTQYVAPSMRARGAGSIVNVGSIIWRIPETTAPVYATVKAAVVGMTRVHAREFGADGVRVNSVMPGATATENQIREVLTPEYEAYILAGQSLKRRIMPEEVARLMLFLAADDSSGITGSNYVIDGGWVGDK